MPEAASARFAVEGRVQGVGYRFFVVRTARDLGLRGWVRNRADGGVEVAARGSAEALVRLEAALRQGPRLAQVEEVARQPWRLSPQQDRELDGFTIAEE